MNFNFWRTVVPEFFFSLDNYLIEGMSTMSEPVELKTVEIDQFIQDNISEPTAPTAGTAVPEDPQVAFVVTELRNVLNGDVNKLRIMLAVTQAVLIARRLKVSGKAKKDIVSRALRFLVDNSSMSADDKLASHLVLDLGMAQAIDDLVFMATSGINMKLGRGLFSCCFGASKAEVQSPKQNWAPPALWQ
jgi:hypothetical protein